MHINKHTQHTHKLKKSGKIVKKHRVNLHEELQLFLEKQIDFTLKKSNLAIYSAISGDKVKPKANFRNSHL